MTKAIYYRPGTIFTIDAGQCKSSHPVSGGPARDAIDIRHNGVCVERGFFGKLFDLSFESFITTSIIRILYILLIVLAGLTALVILISAATQGAAAALFGLILAPIVFLVYVIFGRVYLEIVIVLFRIAENTQVLADKAKGESVTRTTQITPDM